jgi:8-oxo-dGTP pyrophosphatase MutT (NUDIX family)
VTDRRDRFAGMGPQERAAFIARLNATLPTKRVIAQGLIRDGAGRVLLCELTYKLEWDLPGGVVDPGESPATTLAREVREELGLEVEAGPLLSVNWLPPYRQWDDALLLVFDLGVRPDVTDHLVLQPREIRAVHWVGREELERYAAPYVVRHVGALLDATEGHAPLPLDLEDGVPRRP